jgi:predicted HTH transcriptional regulator
MKFRKTYIEKLVEQGEHQKQDFKFEISDSKKIARSISAFSNTDGGKLLIGVKDNGSIAGVRSEEEIHMLEAAAQMYCKPEVLLKFNEWNVNGKQILEVDIEKSKEELISAPDKNGNFKVFIRFEDQNILANGVFIKAWKKKKQAQSVEIKYTQEEQELLKILKEYQPINFSQIRKKLKCSPARLNQMILDFILINVVELKISDKGYFYCLTETQLEKDEKPK